MKTYIRIVLSSRRLRKGAAVVLNIFFCCVLAAPLAFGQQILQEPAIPGDHPDPSIIRDGSVYWAASTSGNWAPAFPLFRSQANLNTWQQTGSIFPDPPSWAVGNFWAPELVNDRGAMRVYYAAKNKSGVLCIPVANALGPQGLYVDHGPLVCQPEGSIDPAFVRDEQGKPYLIWKEDGNSRHQPNPSGRSHSAKTACDSKEHQAHLS